MQTACKVKERFISGPLNACRHLLLPVMQFCLPPSFTACFPILPATIHDYLFSQFCFRYFDDLKETL
jgi:hypothetical protein